MEAIQTAGIMREPSAEERNDFIPLTDKQDLTPIKTRQEISRKIIARNRMILLNNPQDIKKLSCSSCFEVMNKRNMTCDSFKENFQKFEGRLELDTINFHKRKAKFSDSFEVSIAIRLKNCPYCSKKFTYGFTNLEMKKEMFEELKKEALAKQGANLEKW